MKIIGIGGLPRSGKDTVADMYMDAGYFGVSFGDITRSYSYKRHSDKPDPVSVANMTETSNWLRETRGEDVLLQEALRRYEEASKTKAYKGLLLFSIRAVVEADFVLSHHGELIWVEARDDVRYERGINNLRQGEISTSLEEFKRQEALQWKPQPGIPPESQMNIAYVKQHATKTLENNGNEVEAFKIVVKKTLTL